MRFRLAPGLGIAAALLCAAPLVARATMVVPLDLDALVDQAERISLARVVSQTARFTADRNAIFTEVTLVVEQPLKGGGKAGDRVVVRREGGEVEGIGMRVVGAASFTPGEQVLVFLERRAGALWTVGMAQGKLHVAERDGARVVIRNTAGLAFLQVQGQAPRPEPSVERLDAVLGRIADRVRAGKAVTP
jgi:hypothetical protein